MEQDQQSQSGKATEPVGAGRVRIDVERAEAVLVERYPQLVRFAYLILPPGLGRHRRVLAAHAVVQRSLPRATRTVGGIRARAGGGRPAASVTVTARRTPTAAGAGAVGTGAVGTGTGISTADRTGTGITGAAAAQQEAAEVYACVRLRLLRTLLTYGRRPRWWPARLPAPAALRPSLPAVWGLRLFPSAGGADELALERALSLLGTEARAACALRWLEALPESDVLRSLAEAGAADPAGAREATDGLRLPSAVPGDVLRSPEFDPYAVQARPTDLLRRRHRIRGALIGTLTAGVGLAVLVTVSSVEPDPYRAYQDGRARAGSPLDPAALVRAGADTWADTSRVDFGAWPARGARKDDTELLGRALAAWARPAGVHRSVTPGTSVAPPATPPRLLYAGEVEGVPVVLLHEGGRVVRYTESAGTPGDSGEAGGPGSHRPGGSGRGGGGPELEIARVDDAGVTTAAALVLRRTGTTARYLTAPWISEARTRDLRTPGAHTRPLARDGEGVTGRVQVPPAPSGSASGIPSGTPSGPVGRTGDGAGSGGRTGRGGCTGWPALQLRSSEKIVERHAFLVTDLGDLAPAHLTYTPHPGSGAPARQPREATSPAALRSWEDGACGLSSLRGEGVKAVNNWEFAHQKLPGGAGRAAWFCARADTWRGEGQVSVRFRPGGPGPGSLAARVRDTAACGRFGQHVLAGVRWRSEQGHWYQLAAGSRAVDGIRARGGVRGSAEGATLALRTEKDADAARLTARLKGGGRLKALETSG